jgi:ribosomal protein L35
MTSHMLEHKNAKRKRRLGNDFVVAKADEKRIKGLLRK